MKNVLGLSVSKDKQGKISLVAMFGGGSAEEISGQLLSEDDETVEFVTFKGDGDENNERIIAVLAALYETSEYDSGTFPVVFDDLLKTVFELGQKHPQSS